MRDHKEDKRQRPVEICITGKFVIEHRQAGASRPSGGFGFKIGLPHRKKDNRMPLELKITNVQQVRVTVSPKTDSGKPASIDGKPSWSTVSGNSQIQVSEDGLSALLVSSNDPGDTQFLVKADANLGTNPEDYEEISDIITLSVLGEAAKNLGLVAGTPEPKPELPPV